MPDHLYRHLFGLGAARLPSLSVAADQPLTLSILDDAVRRAYLASDWPDTYRPRPRVIRAHGARYTLPADGR